MPQLAESDQDQRRESEAHERSGNLSRYPERKLLSTPDSMRGSHQDRESHLAKHEPATQHGKHVNSEGQAPRNGAENSGGLLLKNRGKSWPLQFTPQLAHAVQQAYSSVVL